nr:NAD dependent epimerase/dehydratase family [uncultured bacterium]
MRAVVTGAAGFIGSTLVDRLLHEGHQVVAIDNLSTGLLANLDQARRTYRLNRRFTFVQNDILAPELSDIVAGCAPDVIFHLAAQVNLRASITDPQFDARNNVLGTINVLEAARKGDVKRIVYAASGGSRYGAPEQLPVHEAVRTDPISPYAVAKLAGEMYMRAYAEMYGLSQICLALANVYGPRQNPHGEAGVITVFGRALLTGDRATIYGDGSASRDYVYVDDVVDAFMRAGSAPHGTVGTYNIGTGSQVTVLEVHQLIAAALGSPASPTHIAAKSGELHAIALDTTKAHQDLGWSPRVDLVDGVGRTIEWLHGALAPELAELVGA